MGWRSGRLDDGSFNWISILRLGLVQTALGAIVVLTNSTLNRVMVVELQLAASVPGLLVGWHYVVQMTRPRWGYGSDRTRKRTPWIIGGMAVLAVGGFLAALATAWMAISQWQGMALAAFAFMLIGLGVGASGTALLTLLATGVNARRRPAAASLVWIMMIMGFVLTTVLVGQNLDPFSWQRLVTISGIVSLIAFALACLALFGLEGSPALHLTHEDKPKIGFMAVLRDVWAETEARRFTIFVFISMLAYSTQELILEPFAGLIFKLSPGETTSLSGMQNTGVLVGMIVVALAGSAWGRGRFGSLRFWAVTGCLVSALAFAGLVYAAHRGPGWPLVTNVFVLGLGNGAFAVAAIGSMMGLANRGDGQREGTRMGLWGAAQAIGFGIGVTGGTIAVDLAGYAFGSPNAGYGVVFALEAGLFVLSALIALRLAPIKTPDYGNTMRLEAVTG